MASQTKSSNNIFVSNRSGGDTTTNSATSGRGGSSAQCAAQAAAEASQSRQAQQNEPHRPASEDWSDIPHVVDARPILPLAAFYMGDLRDGLPMLNMQAAYLISAKGFNEKQVGILFFFYGISQFFCMAPAGYFLDYSNRKIDWVLCAGTAASVLTVLTAITAEEGGKNMALMIFWKVIQGGITAILPPGFNGITLGIVGSTGFTHQVSRNRMMNHIGTALIVASGSLLAYFLYPNIGALFLVSPLAAIGMAYNLRRIKPKHVDRDAARGLIIESPTMNEYEQYDEAEEAAAIEAAALSWQMMEDENDQNGGPSKTDDQKEEFINQQLSHNAHNHNQSCPYSPCGGNPSGFTYNPPLQNHPASPSASATSSSYMPPDILNSEHTSKELLREQNIVLLTSPIHEHEEGFQFSGTQIGQRPTFNADQSTYKGGRTDQPSVAATYASGPSFNMGYNNRENSFGVNQSHPVGQRSRETPSQPSSKSREREDPPRKARTPFAVLMDPTLMIFTAVIFFFHMANSSVLPLVMQSLALEDPQAGILLSGLCILIAQAFMSYFAKVCGDYSPLWGRKNLVLLGLASLTVRCFLLAFLVSAEANVTTDKEATILKVLILSTQLLDAVGAGILGCLHILVTNDISGGTGRFSLMLGVTTGAMCLGGTVSGYIGQAIAQDYGYPFAFTALGIMSLVPFLLYIFFMPETLPDYARPNQQTFKKRRKRLVALLRRLSESRRQLVAKANPFVRRKSQESLVPDTKDQPLNKDDGLAAPTTMAEPKALASHVELV